MTVVDITGTERTETGKKATKADRRAGFIPCEIYSPSGNQHLKVEIHDIKNLIYTPEFKLANITLNGATFKCIVKEIQFHPVTDEIQHIDFQELVEQRLIKVNVPVRFHGTSPGVKGGGKLIENVRKIKIKCTPEQLIDHVSVDISEVQLGQSVRVRDIEAIEGVEIMANPGIPLATVEVPRSLKSEASKQEATVE